MIIRESEEAFVMTTQDDHAHFSEEVARGFREEWFLDGKYKDDCLLAIQEHDRSWIRLDAMPIWNDRSNVPFSFIDYPVLPKLVLYQIGVDETEEMSRYAAMLCSMHYASFFQSDQDSRQEAELAFYQRELARQERLKEKLNYPDEQTIARHFQLLQLCDDISLYVCMNPEGVSKEEEHPWFREGFSSLVDGQKFSAAWISDHEVRLTPQLFAQEWTAVLRNKHVPKKRIKEVGVHEAYQESGWTELKVTFV
ncbi:DUF3891 family protein [Paenibacillus sp. N3/727]|uniref:DUF3891 family protein n=1 Tax=Paenibacillus sp. N3/727 TaxID=2925845 RepID=UPI001F52BD57|nr:DUF3891 family protein [Paenibacillus sp. N3/727]UNK18651.1 DUF3891 family protein [Paenibacillus sp. N3/727]